MAAWATCLPGRHLPHGRLAVGVLGILSVSHRMALAIRFEQLLREGHIATYAELARLGHVTDERISQIMNLLFLAPDVQEALLFRPRTQRGRDSIILRDLQPIAAQ